MSRQESVPDRQGWKSYKTTPNCVESQGVDKGLLHPRLWKAGNLVEGLAYPSAHVSCSMVFSHLTSSEQLN